MDENEFKRKIYEKHSEHFDHLYSLHALAEESIRTYTGFTKDHYQGALVLIFPRAYKSFDAVRRLCEIASCEDAAVVLRSLLNLVVVTRWITLGGQTRARKYLAWYWVEMNRELEQFKGSIPSSWNADVQKGYNAVKSQFEYSDAKGRTKVARQWYEPEASSIRDLFRQVDLEKQYDEGYKPLSGIEHSDAIAFIAMVGQGEKGGNHRRLEIQSDLFVPPYLRNAFQWFADIFRICNKTIALTDSKKLDEVITAGIEFYRADMQAKGIPSD